LADDAPDRQADVSGALMPRETAAASAARPSDAVPTRLAAAGYQRSRERDGCARCCHSQVAGEERKAYTCTLLGASVNANGHCREFTRIEAGRPPEPKYRQVVMREIAAAVGHATAYQVVRRWGGRELRVPVRLDENHPIALALGLDAARRLVKAFAGQRLDLPLETNVLRQRRDEAILRDRARGMSDADCALVYGLTRQGVRSVYAKARAQPQGSRDTPDAGEASTSAGSMSAGVLAVRSWHAGLYTCTVTVRRSRPGALVSCSVEWDPKQPSSLTETELRQYRRGRDDVLAEISREFGFNAAVLEL